MRADLIRWFEHSRVPRYTSYPTAPHFTPAVTTREHAAWLQQLPEDEPVSVYLHVPFCRVLCWYCGCHTRLTRDRKRIDAYAGQLAAELALVATNLAHRPPVRHLHWGGGTPTALGVTGFTELMSLLRRHFAFENDAELAIELDPRTVDHVMMDVLRANGINRASLGVQSFDERVQAAINRVQGFDTTQEVADGLRARGIERLNVDLIYGLPFQTVANCVATVRQVASLRPDRVAIFGYAHVPGFKPQQRMIDAAALPDPAQRVAQYEAMAEELDRHGYARIGLDHFALPGDSLAVAAAAGTLRRNFQGYTTDSADTLIGLGASSISSFRQGYVQNLVDLKAYRDAVQVGRLPTGRGVALTAADRLRRDLIDTVMCRGEVDLAEVARRHGATTAACEPDPERLAMIEQLGIARREGNRLVVDPGCRPLLRVVAAAFDTYLQGAGAVRHSAAV